MTEFNPLSFGAAVDYERSRAGETGELRIHEQSSRVFDNTRRLRVWLPPGYSNVENEGRRYPVFYLNDGQNLFDPATAFAGVDWHVSETLTRLICESVVPPMIVVGIDNATVERITEFMPYRSLFPLVPKPHGKHYPDFLLREIMPFIERAYRVARGAKNTGLGGSSLGALISLHTVISRPGIFGRLLLESPSLFVSNRQLLKDSRACKSWPQRIFLAVGTRESGQPERDQRIVDDVRSLAHSFHLAGLRERRLRVVIQEGASHNEAAWAARFPEAASFLFGE
jgi:predicted alpha/beta superfamily hydrolase